MLILRIAGLMTNWYMVEPVVLLTFIRYLKCSAILQIIFGVVIQINIWNPNNWQSTRQMYSHDNFVVANWHEEKQNSTFIFINISMKWTKSSDGYFYQIIGRDHWPLRTQAYLRVLFLRAVKIQGQEAYWICHTYGTIKITTAFS